jgi:four helix bundle protein
VYQLSFELAMVIFRLCQNFPAEEKYSLTNQIVRSSRSVSANIAECWGKRVYEKKFKNHLIDANGSLDETKPWFAFAKECGYINEEEYLDCLEKARHIGAKLFNLHDN